MRKKRLLLAVTIYLSTLFAYGNYTPNLKYAKWLNAFSIDNVWQFSKKAEKVDDPLDGCSFQRFPGVISWSMMSWKNKVALSDDHNMSNADIYIVNWNDPSDQIWLCKIIPDGNYEDDGWRCRSIDNKNNNVTYTAYERETNDDWGTNYLFFVTYYTDEVLDLIKRANGNVGVRSVVLWDDDDWNLYDQSSQLEASDCQLFPTLPTPQISNPVWTVHDNQTCLKFTHDITSTQNERKLILQEQISGWTYVDFTPNSQSYSYYHIPDLNKNHYNSLNDYNELYIKVLSSETYDFNDANYATDIADIRGTRKNTIYSSKAKVKPPCFAQPYNPSAEDKHNGSNIVRWNCDSTTASMPYDTSAFVVERATDTTFTLNRRDYYVSYKASQREYELADSFDLRSQSGQTFYYRIHRQNAAATELNASAKIGCNTNYATFDKFEAYIDSAAHRVNLRWGFNQGIRNDELLVHVTYGNNYLDISSDSTRYNGIMITECVQTLFSAQLYANNAPYDASKPSTVTLPHADPGVIDTMMASAGYYNDHVNVKWKIDPDYPYFSNFVVTRTEYNSNDQTAETLTSMDYSSGVNDYTYVDNSCVPGVYYEYKVIGMAMCDDQLMHMSEKSAIGFAQPYGVVSGQITYSGNQAVRDVTVVAECESQYGGKSLSLSAERKPTIEMPVEIVRQILPATAGTIEFYLKVDDPTTLFPLIQLGDMFSLKCRNNSLFLSTGTNQPEEIHNAIEPGIFTHIAITFATTGNQRNVVLYKNGDTIASMTVTLAAQSVQINDVLRFGNDGVGGYLTGNLDEMRIWNTQRTAEEIKRYMTTYLNGTEQGLVAYYRCDDDVSRMIFDLSKTGNNYNSRHIPMSNVVIDALNIPTAEQLSHKAYTDANGNYLFNNIPYSTQGTLYNMIPMLGIHEFSPSMTPLFFNTSANTHNNIDFDDVSSFPVSGKVTFFNTNYPVEDCRFYIDGVSLCTNGDGEPIESDENGEYTISVPIGHHSITIQKGTHVFANEGRYPADPHNTGTTYNFVSEVTNLTFQDSTFMLVTGRVSGGSDEEKKPHGFAVGKATIGQARITLSTRGDLYNLNLDEENGRTFTMPADSLFGPCNSIATTGRAYQNLAHYITIMTDSMTGEFNVMLPPIDYQIKSAELVNNNGYIYFNLNSIGDIELSEMNENQTSSDSMMVDSTEYVLFNYYAAVDMIHHCIPTLEVKQNDNNMAYGSPEFYYEDAVTHFYDTIPLYTIDSSGNVTYKFGHPCFVQGDTGSWKIRAYERYINYDNADTTLQPFRYAIVNVSSNFAEQVKNSIALTDTTISTSDNEIVTVNGNELMLDGDGTTTYSFIVGEPNIMPPYTSSFSITYQDPQRTRYYDWDSDMDKEAIVLGAKVIGSNFVTKGPDEVFYILRDPVGSDSYAEWTSGNVVTKTHVTTDAFTREENGQWLFMVGCKDNLVVAPMGAGNTISLDIIGEDGITETYKGSTTSRNTQRWTFVNTETVSTSPTHELVGSAADVFIGKSTNRLYGNASEVYIKRDTTGNYSIDRKEVLSVATEFDTKFNYTQDYVERYLIPNLESLRNQLLIQVPVSQYDTAVFINYDSVPVYITTLAPNDPAFGKNDTYLMVYPYSWLNDSTDKRVFVDEVYNYNNQIRRWIDVLTHNERCKAIVHNSTKSFEREAWERVVYGSSDDVFKSVRAPYIDSNYSLLDTLASKYKGGWLDANYSLGAGAGLSVNETRSYSTVSNGNIETDGFVAGAKGENIVSVKGKGVTIKWEAVFGETHTSNRETEKSDTSSVTYNLCIGTYDALTVDVYQSPDGYGPIFAARGGQTTCPYQDSEYTKYYEPGEHEIQAATVPTAMPRITVQNPVMTNVPVGKKAIFNVELANTATPYAYSNFVLRQDAATNPSGAVLRVDGNFVSDGGLTFTFHENQVYNKILELSQTRADILDYDSIAVILKTDCYRFDADTIWISAHFVQTCSDVSLGVDRNVLNNTTGNTVRFTIDGFEQDFRNLEGIQLQYMTEGDDQWHMLKQFPADSAAVINYDLSFTKPSYPDGTYRFRAVTLCRFGNEYINNESEEVTVVVDMSAPEALGQPYPLDGIYTANNQVYVDFSESIQTGRVLSDNVLVEGVLNAHQVDHSVSLNLDNNTAVSNATYKLGSEPFTLEMWINYSEPGTIFSYAGGGNTGMEIAIDANDHMTATVNGVAETSTGVLIPGTWLYIVFQYDASTSVISSSYAYDDQTVTLFHNHMVARPATSGNIRFGGNGLKAKMHEAVLWQRVRTLAESLAERSMSKTAYTPDIISLWHMEEGKGVIASDFVRQRNLTLSNDYWAYSHVNYAMNVAAGDSATIDLSESALESSNSYLFEFWFRTNGDAELFHLSDTSFYVGINSGNLVMNGYTVPVRNYQDNAWHHLAIINQKISTPVVAIDGVQVASPLLRKLPTFGTGEITFGHSTNQNALDIDEVRLWNINTTLDAVRQQMNACIRGDEDGLMVYYPFEEYVTDPITSQISTEFTLADKSDNTRPKSIIHSNAAMAQAASAPALVESRPVEYVSHTNTASNDRIVVNITEQPSRIEGCTLEITVKDIVDANGNYSEPIRWTVFVNRNQMVWDENAYTVVKDEIVDTTLMLTIVNNSSVVQNWSIDNIPSCMTLSETSGRIQPLQTKTISCTIDATADRGENEYILYLKGNESMESPLYITTKVYANKPDWHVDPSQYEHSMNIIAYAEINGAVADDEEDMVATFVDGELVGVTNLQLLPATGRYFALMTIFQNTPDTAAPRQITFRYWDASAGVIYSNARVYATINDTTFQLIPNVTYQDNIALGDVINPLRLVMGDEIEQTLELNNGWNWISFNVEPASTSFTDILSQYLNDFHIIKSQTGYAVPDVKTSSVLGNIGSMKCSVGYKIKTSSAFDLQLSGFATSIDSVINFGAQTWTWFGYLPQKSLTVNAALSNINPNIGDIIKSQTQFATWDGYQWVGSLSIMSPGKSYIYKNKGSNDIQFTFPEYAAISYMLPSMDEAVESYFDPINAGLYQGNMNITAVVKYAGEEVSTAEVGIFAGSECRASATYNSGYYFITVPGDSAVVLNVKVHYNDSVYTLSQSIKYQNDAVIGTIDEPYVIELSPKSTSVVTVAADSEGDKVEKIMIDNEVFIIRNGEIYDILGRPRK